MPPRDSGFFPPAGEWPLEVKRELPRRGVGARSEGFEPAGFRDFDKGCSFAGGDETRCRGADGSAVVLEDESTPDASGAAGSDGDDATG